MPNEMGYAKPSLLSQEDPIGQQIPPTGDGLRRGEGGGGGGDPQVATSDWWVTPLLAVLVTSGFFGLLAVLCYHKVPPSNLAMMNIVLGSLGTTWVGAMSFFFGTSRGSQRKDLLLFQSKPAGPTA
jgi:hypothetical protein